MGNKDWKSLLLKSGLPFEYEVKECFVEQKCIVWDEYSYLRQDENQQEKEFSYDIDANYWQGGNSFNFMIECKYKTELTNWFFLPNPYGFQKDVTPNSFLHPVDFFTENKFHFTHTPYETIQKPLGPSCLKGVEIFQNQYLELNIFKAINQLSYAFVEQLIQAMSSQLENKMFFDTVFFNVPVIITNADLYLINQKLTTANVEKATAIEEVSEKHDFLLFHNKIGESLRLHNLSALAQFFGSLENNLFETRNKSFSKTLDHFIDVLSKNYCPEVILIMHHDQAHKNYERLFDYINFMVKPSEQLSAAVKKVTEDFKSKMERMDELIKKKT